MAWPCPVCGAGTVTDYQHTLDEGTVCESQEHCPNGCQEYTFAYGGSEERIGDKVWSWHYTESREEELQRRKDRAEQIEKMKAK